MDIRIRFSVKPAATFWCTLSPTTQPNSGAINKRGQGITDITREHSSWNHDDGWYYFPSDAVLYFSARVLLRPKTVWNQVTVSRFAKWKAPWTYLLFHGQQGASPLVSKTRPIVRKLMRKLPSFSLYFLITVNSWFSISSFKSSSIQSHVCLVHSNHI